MEEPGGYYKLFMDANPPRFNSREGEDKAESWLVEIDGAFDVIELPKSSLVCIC